ncbi:MAG TPA: hypothetical protein VKM94_07105 [Blastocatellia bacterium]|nr:hypothetical protein [Blastocatellia bacterium]
MQTLYRLKEACTFFPYDGRADECAFILRAPDNRQFKVSALAKEILQQLDGRTSLHQIVDRLNNRNIDVTLDELQTLISTRYRALGIVEDPSSPTENPAPARQNRPLPFLLHWELVPAHIVQRASSKLTFMFSKPAALLSIAFILAAHFLVYIKYVAPQFVSHAGFLWVLVICLLSVLWHELGHSSAVTRFGGSPGKIGFGLFVLLPSFFADVSEIWRFPRRHRMVVDLAGVYFQEVFFSLTAIVGVFTGAPECFVVCRFIDLMVLLTVNPVFQFDGYWFLADWLALPNLYRLALSYLGSTLKKLFSGRESVRQLPSMPKHAYIVFLLYAALCNLFLAAVGWMSYRYVYSTFAKVHLIAPAVFTSMVFAFKTHDVALFINRFLTLFFVIAFPATALVGIFRYASMLVSYLTKKVQVVRVSQSYLSEKTEDVS